LPSNPADARKRQETQLLELMPEFLRDSFPDSAGASALVEEGRMVVCCVSRVASQKRISLPFFFVVAQ
jgi:hypothetical protein